MNSTTRHRAYVAVLTACLIVFSSAVTQAADKLGKVFIKVSSPEPGGQQFIDPTLEDTVKDLKRRARSFVVVEDETSADFLIVVVSREDTPVSGQPTAKRVTVTLSVRDGASSWKPGIKVSKVTSAWGLSALRVITDAEKWIKANAAK